MRRRSEASVATLTCAVTARPKAPKRGAKMGVKMDPKMGPKNDPKIGFKNRLESSGTNLGSVVIISEM